ncbi:MAG: PTS sugar transporter subunit IIA [Spirochaetales bacterium]|nr:PTS sugar transporter subunit IIA [Spirochaetales bacterium]
MPLLEQIDSTCIKLPLLSTSKEDVLQELVSLVHEAGLIEETGPVVQALEEREALCSTGLGGGIAIPHAKPMNLSDVIIALGISPEGIDFEALDGLPSTIFFLILAPPDQPGLHGQALAEIAGASQSPDFVANLVAARSAEEVISLLRA